MSCLFKDGLFYPSRSWCCITGCLYAIGCSKFTVNLHRRGRGVCLPAYSLAPHRDADRRVLGGRGSELFIAHISTNSIYSGSVSPPSDPWFSVLGGLWIITINNILFRTVQYFTLLHFILCQWNAFSYLNAVLTSLFIRCTKNLTCHINTATFRISATTYIIHTSHLHFHWTGKDIRVNCTLLL